MTPITCSCNDWSRARLLRSAAAQAGQGLPAIEPGMPMPAGTGLTRRSFVSRAAGLAFAVYGAASLGPRAFEEGIAAAAAAAPGERGARFGVPLRRRRLDDRAGAHRRPALRDAPSQRSR